MSWGGDHSIEWFEAPLQTMLAAGAYPVFAAGNVEPMACGSVLEPAWYPGAIAVGGLSGQSLYTQSGKGPGADGSTIKPDLVAPAVAIKSILSAADSGRDAYFELSGTSMAAPHVAGALALLLSTRQPGEPLAALKNTTVTSLQKPAVGASSCRGTSWDSYPNNLYGWGLPDVCAAAKALGVAC